MALLNRDGAAPVAAEVLSRPDGEDKAGDHDGSSQPEGPKPGRPGLKIEPAQRDASCREEDDRDQEDEGAQDTRDDGLEMLGGFRIDGFDLPVDEKGDPENGKEGFVEPEQAGPPGTEDVTPPGKGEFECRFSLFFRHHRLAHGRTVHRCDASSVRFPLALLQQEV